MRWIKHGNRVAEQAEFPRGRSADAQRRIGSCLRMRFESVSLSGFAKRTLKRELPRRKAKERGTRCTLTTAQKVIQYEGQLQNGVMANRKICIFQCNKQLVSGSSDEKIKLIRAQGGCHGTIRRRKTWQAAISYGEPQAGNDP